MTSFNPLNKHIIIQAHGFNSGPGQKAVSLQQRFPEAIVIAPQLPYDPFKALEILEDVYKNYPDGSLIQFVGTSLGAFYGLILSTKYHSALHSYYLINTSLQPHHSLEGFLNTTVTNFKTMERYYIEEAYLSKLSQLHRRIQAGMNGNALKQIRVFEGSEDDVIDHSIFRYWLKSYEQPVQISIHEQDHRFEDITPVMNAMESECKDIKDENQN